MKVIPYSHMQYARRIRRYGKQTNVAESTIRAAIRAGLPMLEDRTPESVSYEFGRRFRGHNPTGSTAA